ncbi:MAG TPA: hypothetical protein VFJ85_15865 [Acidimicrobiales bacterium]|nr:hypothetical protein [Acidimicrobiales bacterium]
MPDDNDGLDDVVAQLTHLLKQATDPSRPVLPRIAQANTAGPYLETVIRILVGQARAKGHSWQELADVFVTSPMGVQSRFGALRDYSGEEE